MRLLLCALAMLLCSHPALGAIYKCTVNGRIIFSDRPCEGSSTDKHIYMRGSTESETTPSNPTDTDRGTKTLTNDPDDECAADIVHKLKIKYLLKTEEVDNTRKTIRGLMAHQEMELDALREKKRAARNNMAGATWEQSISQEMDAIAASYRNKMSYHNAALDRLEDEHRILKDRLTECIGDVPF